MDVPYRDGEKPSSYLARAFYDKTHMRRCRDRKKIRPAEFAPGSNYATDRCSITACLSLRDELNQTKQIVRYDNGVPVFRVPPGVGGCPI